MGTIYTIVSWLFSSNERTIEIGIIIIAAIYIVFLHVQKSTLYEEINDLVQVQSKQEVEINLLKSKEIELNNIINLKNSNLKDNEKVIAGLQEEVKNINDSNAKASKQIAEYQKMFLTKKSSNSAAIKNKTTSNTSTTKNESKNDNKTTLINSLNKHFSIKHD